MSAWRARIRPARRRHAGPVFEPGADPPPVFWGRIGPYEGVTRHGVLFLLAPDAVHPTLRVRSGA